MPALVFSPDTFLNSFVENYAEKTESVSADKHFTLASDTIRISSSSKNFLDYFTAGLRHLETTNTQSQLHILIVDHKTSKMSLPKPFWNQADIDPLSGNVLNLPDRYYVNCNNINNTLTFIDYDLKTAIFWADDISAIPEWEKGFPFRTLLFNWFYKKNYLFIHAAGISKSTSGVLLTGKGGSGKSTTALACLQSSLLYAGDDYIMVDPENCIGYSLYNIGKLEAHNVFRFPEFKKFIVNEHALDTEKGRLFVSDFYPEKIIKQFTIKAILLPKYTGLTETTIKHASKADAMKAMAPSSIWLLRTDAEMVKKIASLIRKLPCYWLYTGTNLQQIPLKIEELINSI